MSSTNQQNNDYDCRSVLAIDDDPDFMILLKSILKQIIPTATFYAYNPEEKGRPDKSFNWSKFDLVLLDYDLGDGEKGLDWLRRYKTSENFPTTVMLTAQGNEEIAVQAMRFGVEDYINKQQLSMDRLTQALKNAMEKKQQQLKQATAAPSLQTTLFNKVDFYKKLRDELKAVDENNDTHSFIMQINIDAYDKLYEKYGILATDSLCSDLAKYIARGVMGDGHKVNITRLGDALIGCLITQHPDADAGKKTAMAICEHIQDYSFALKEDKLTSTVSIGIVSISQAEDNPDLLLNQANKACQQAGQKSGNSCALVKQAPSKKPKQDSAEPQKTKPAKTAAKPASAKPKPVKKSKPVVAQTTGEAVTKETASAKKPAQPKYNLTEAVKQNRIQPYYQPFMALSESANMFNAEFFQLTVNIVDTKGTVITRESLTEVNIEKGGLSLLDRWMIRHGLGQLSSNKDEDIEYGLFIRLSTESFSNNDLFDWMMKLIIKTKSSRIASKVVFEISPPEFLSNKDIMQEYINKMRDTWGITFSLQDVINPVVLETCVKLAGFEFAKINVPQVPIDDINAITERARQLGTLTVMENIQDGEQLNQAVLAGPDYGQGDFIQPAQDTLITSNDEIEL